ncbi:hypothetical protein TNCV_3789541 [Trichonephila clavipes]|nr:hypothetical protein TNCV_3789541 [Trichonephila clavipes]
MLKVMHSWYVCIEFESSTAEDRPCRECQCTLNVWRLKHPLVSVVTPISHIRRVPDPLLDTFLAIKAFVIVPEPVLWTGMLSGSLSLSPSFRFFFLSNKSVTSSAAAPPSNQIQAGAAVEPPLVSLMEEEERWEAPDHPQVLCLKIGVEMSQIVLSPVWCSNMRLTTGVTKPIAMMFFVGLDLLFRALEKKK